MRPVRPAPSPTPLLIGAKLRSSRSAQGLTIADLAEATHLTKGFISRVERNQISPSVATLVTICQVLSLSIGSLFEPAEHELVRLAEAPLINMGGDDATERLLTPRNESRVQLLRSTLAPGSSGGADLYTINCDVEVVHVLRNCIELRFARGNVLLSEGDTLTLPGRDPHTWINPTDRDSEVVWTIVPAAWSGSS